MDLVVDTSAWYALQDKTDVNHARAIGFWEEIKSQQHRLVTTDRIREEAATLIQRKLGKEAALVFLELLEVGEERGEIVIIRVTSEIEQEAWDLFRLYCDKEYSFVDCTTFCVAARYQYRHAFTFDRDFEHFGIERLPG